jgi:hypothetical protein
MRLSLTVVLMLQNVFVIATLGVGFVCGRRIRAPTMWSEYLLEPDHDRQELNATAEVPFLHGDSTMEHGCAPVVVTFP